MGIELNPFFLKETYHSMGKFWGETVENLRLNCNIGTQHNSSQPSVGLS
jgi:hypothetical protein